MIKRLILACALCMSVAVFAEHGLDERLFLEPHIQSELKNLSGEVILDAGCGSAPWGIVAAQNGASVCGIDMQKPVIDLAQKAIATAGVESQIALCQGDVEHLPYGAGTFDRALSINTGCNLPATVQCVSQDYFQVTGLAAHIYELGRVMKEGGQLVVTAPASYGVVFTDGSQHEKAVRKHISQVLSKIGRQNSPEVVVSHLNQLKEVNRATFVRRNDKLTLVTDERELKIGEPIWRKTPEGVVQSFYHSEEEYLVAFRNAGLTCEEIKRPCFFGKVKYDQFRATLKADESALSTEYIDNNPFTIYYVAKRA